MADEKLSLVPLEPSEKLIWEILYNINRKRQGGNELSDADVREVISNLHFNGPFAPPEPTPALTQPEIAAAREAGRREGLGQLQAFTRAVRAYLPVEEMTEYPRDFQRADHILLVALLTAEAAVAQPHMGKDPETA